MNSPVDSANATRASSIIREAPGAWRDLVNRQSFAFQHSLVGHPLFDLPRLAKLGGDMLKNHGEEKLLLQVAESVPNVRKQWANFTPVQKIDSAIANIQSSGSWVMIKDAQFDPAYKALLDEIILDLERVSGMPLRQEITWGEVGVFIGSPNSVTHYHIDSETNFLFQIHGHKQAHLYDQSDRSVISDEEIEQFFYGELNAATLRPDAKSKMVDFKPGTGIHIPVSAPHWVKNLDDYSVSLSILLYLRSMDARAHVYQVNHMLRKMGLKPTPPGVSPTKDRAKALALELVSVAQPATKRQVIHSGLDRVKGVAGRLKGTSGRVTQQKGM